MGSRAQPFVEERRGAGQAIQSLMPGATKRSGQEPKHIANLKFVSREKFNTFYVPLSLFNPLSFVSLIREVSLRSGVCNSVHKKQKMSLWMVHPASSKSVVVTSKATRPAVRTRAACGA